MKSNLVYDFGLHRGEDTEFYLKKGFRVVAVEANPELVQECKSKFSNEITLDRLSIVAGAIAPPSAGDEVTFYKNKRASIWGTIEPDWADRNTIRGFESEAIQLPRIDVPKLFAQFGVPHYVKIDVEGVDTLVLEAIRKLSGRPQYISIESEKVDFEELINEFNILESLGYRKFKVVQQRGIPGRSIQSVSIDGSSFQHTFLEASSGPFGEEISQPWVTKSEAILIYKRIFNRYRMFGDKSLYAKLPRVMKAPISFGYKAITNYRGPLPGWFDTHASL